MIHHVEPSPVCEDLVLAVLAKLPSRELVQARNVSRAFQVLADEVLRKRFVDIAESRSTQLILESCAPYEQRAHHRKPLSFSHFAPSTSVFSGNVALFAVDSAAGEPEPLHLALEDGDVFQQSILSVHLRAAPPKQPVPVSSAPTAHNVDDIAMVDETDQPVAAPRFIDYAWTLDVASSLDRFFRSWFLESASEASSASSSPSTSRDTSRESSPQPPSPSRDTRRRQLGSPAYNPTGRSALLSASISCVQVPLDSISPEGDEADVLWALASRNGGASSSSSPSSSPGTRFGSPASSASSSRSYEYFFDEVALDVGKVVVLAEEGLPGFARETSASELGTRAGARVLSL
ncbi:uncharacterized protein RHOBADRAFT_50809 [Rhodotorula graminis WP1]|uniref:F-box domain-containing protein n=1 Tax=Rhodotorula graminis (strain WP1) TaxID=578459 RepID=A0A194SFH3_RHOGW|nr:uncharacterized protein RHOBADRAFT_50809 [Rhodotorula graminis WP1]KPV78331.1 hypothetical protein RHOBADRAFT_50809 [Rhodotorula graminis WP1]